MSMRLLQARYAAAQVRLEERFAAAVAKTRVDTTREATVLAERLGVSLKRRAASQYVDVAGHLLCRYSPEVAYLIAVEMNEQFEQRLGYPPIGQIMKALEELGGEDAARWIGCSLRNFPRVETARLAFGVITSPAVRSLVGADLAAEDSELAEYITAGVVATPRTTPPQSWPEPAHTTAEAPGHQTVSDGIERMPRRLTEAERRGDRLYLHLQAVSLVVLLFLPVLGGVLRGWTGAAVGLVMGWFARVWMRRSMGLRGSNPHDGFFVRMRERANGSRRGLLEILIERVRRRPFTRAQCVAITQAWDETRRRLAETQSVEVRGALLNELDARIKRISYGRDG